MPPWRQVGLGFALVAMAGLAAEMAYFQEFAYLSPWDDEGYFLLALRHLLDGYRLYDDVYVFYGPLYFVAKLLLHGSIGLPLTDDVVRITTLVFRLATAAASAGCVLRLTRNAPLAIIAFGCIAARQIFGVLEPGHPQEFVALFTAMLPLAATLVGQRPSLASACLGCLVASLVLVKVNVGVFALISVGMSLLAATIPRRGCAALRSGALATALLVPWILLRSHLDQWGTLAVITSGGVVALAPFIRLGTGRLGLADLGRFLVGLTGTLGLVLVTVFARGSSLASLVDCLFIYPQSLAKFVTASPPVLEWAVLSATLGVVGSIVAARAAETHRGIVNLGHAAQLLLGIYTVSVLLGELYPQATSGKFGEWGWIVLPVLHDTRFLVLTPLAWLVLLPEASEARPWTRQLPRLVLAWLAVIEPLQVFPRPGSQILVAAQPMALLGLVCCGDGAAWLGSILPAGFRRTARTVTAVVVLTAAIGLLRAEATYWRDTWRDQSPLGFVGTDRLRVTRTTAEAMRGLVAHLKTECPRFVVLPGYQSLYFWTEQPAPAPVLVPHETRLMRDEDFARLAATLDASPESCLVRCRTVARAQLDRRLDALYAHARVRRAFAACTVFDYRDR